MTIPLIVLALMIVLVAGCGDDNSESGPPIRVGGIFTLQGDLKDSTALDGLRLAMREVNAEGGVDVDGTRRELQLILEDDEFEPSIAVARANELINQRGIVALLGPVKSTLAIPVGAVAERGRVPMITSGSTNPATTAGRRYVFRTIFTDDFQGAVAADFARENLGAGTAAVHYEASSPYSSVLADAFTTAFEDREGRVVATTTYTADAPDTTKGLERLATKDFDVLYLPNTNVDTGKQGRRAHRLGIDATLLGGDSWSIDTYSKSVAFQDSYATAFWAPELTNARSQGFVDAFTRAYDRTPGAYEAAAYDSVGLLTRAIEDAGSTDPTAIRNALDATVRYDGVSGTLLYGKGGDPRTDAVVLRASDGEAKLDTEVRPADVER